MASVLLENNNNRFTFMNCRRSAMVPVYSIVVADADGDGKRKTSSQVETNRIQE
jgi:hypothetical protein